MKRLYTLILACGCILPAFAQNNNNLNHTVQVVNNYEGKIKEAERAVSNILVPDSLYHFDLNFDYSGFDTPYKGNDEFNPYLTDLEMEGRAYDGKRLYLKAGAGYVLAPVLDFSYAIKDKGSFKIGAHASVDSHIGSYRQIMPDANNVLMYVKGEKWNGYEAQLCAGMDARADLKSASLLMNLDYEGAMGKGMPCGLLSDNSYNGVNVSLGVDSKHPLGQVWNYALDLSYAFGHERTIVAKERTTAFEHNPRLRFLGAFNFNGGSAFDLEAVVNTTYNIPRQSKDNILGYNLALNPRYYFNNSRVKIGVGVGLFVDGLYKGGKGVQSGNSKIPFAIRPTVSFQWSAVEGALDVYADTKLDSYTEGSRQRALDFSFYFPVLDPSGVGFVNVRKYRFDFGMRGGLGHKFDYDLSVGFNEVKNNLLTVVKNTGIQYATMVCNMPVDTRSLFARASLKGHFGSFSFDADVMYDYFFNQKNMLALPSALSASLDMKYSIRKRVEIGVGADYKSPYKAGDYRTQDIIDLHAIVDFKLTPVLNIFLKGDNLLNRTNQYVPMYARNGICLTAGVVLNL